MNNTNGIEENIVDLTQDTEEDTPLSQLPQLPPSSQPLSQPQRFQQPPPINSQTNIHVHSPPPTHLQNLHKLQYQNRQIPSFKHNQIAPAYAKSPFAPARYEIPIQSFTRVRPIISFSLLSTTEFTARAQGGISREIVDIIRSAPGVRFDMELKKWIFPIEVHDRLNVALSSLHVIVEGLPRSTLAAVLLHQQRQFHRNQPDIQREKILEGINQLKPGALLSNDIQHVLPPRLFEALAPFQREGVEFVVKQNDGRAIIADEMGLGKAQPYTSRILTPFGWKCLGDVKVGDVVTNSQGGSTTVTGVFPQGVKKIVVVTFSDGVAVECCEEHLWRICQAEEGDEAEGGEESRKWSTISTSEISKLIPSSLIEIPLVLPVQFVDHISTLTPHPYLFGMVLGLVASRIVDHETPLNSNNILPFQIDSWSDYEYYQAIFPNLKLVLPFNQIQDLNKQLCSGFYQNDIQDILNLINVTHLTIPDVFLRSSVTCRLNLLRGLCDGSVWNHDETTIRLSSRCRVYSDCIRELVQSLGGTVSCFECHEVEHLDLQITINPFSLPRKMKIFENYKKDFQPHRYITSIVPCGEKKALCISVSSSDHLYVTDNYVITHNTIQAIAATAMYQSEWPVLVFTPSSARYHWKSEVMKWLSPEVLMEDDILVVDAGATMSLLDAIDYKYLIVSYSILSKFQETLLTRRYKVIIADESHYFKNSATKRTKAIVPILQAAPRVIMLTGTPALSRPFELFPQLNALAPLSWSNEKEFIKRYCSGGKSSYGADKNGASNTEELKAILFGTLMISRLKRNILTQLPPKRRHVISVELKDEKLAQYLRSLLNNIKSFRKLYDPFNSESSISASSQDMTTINTVQPSDIPTTTTTSTTTTATPDTAVTLDTTLTPVVPILPVDGNSSLTRKAIMMKLFNESGMAKIDGILNHLNTFLEDRMSGKVIIFAHHRTVLDHISKWLKGGGVDFIRVDGGTMSKDRQKRIEKFQNVSTCRVALLSITSAGVAITLTAASTVYFAELFWTPASLLQAEDRAHRIGQTAEVNIYYFRSKGTIDDLLWPLLQSKINTLGEVFDGVKLLDIEQSTPIDSTELKEVQSLAAQLAEEEVRNAKREDGTEEDLEMADEHPPSKKQKMELHVNKPGMSNEYHFPPSSMSILRSSNESSTQSQQQLDQRRLNRAARIQLLREQQKLSQERPKPDIICLLDDDDNINGGDGGGEERKDDVLAQIEAPDGSGDLEDIGGDDIEVGEEEEEREEGEVDGIVPEDQGQELGVGDGGVEEEDLLGLWMLTEGLIDDMEKDQEMESRTAYEMLSECFTASDFSEQTTLTSTPTSTTSPSTSTSSTSASSSS